MFFNNEQLKQQLIQLRQDPDYQEIKTDIRKAVRYIEKLEYAINNMATEKTKPIKGR
jgi:hypothetical protein